MESTRPQPEKYLQRNYRTILSCQALLFQIRQRGQGGFDYSPNPVLALSKYLRDRLLEDPQIDLQENH
jgi:hypothetical protein